MCVLLLTLAEILKWMNDQAQQVNTTCMLYGRSAALWTLVTFGFL